MKCTRWIAVCVDTFDHEMFEGETYSKRDAWLWLIANAAWKDRRVNHKGTMIEVKRGQVLAGRAFLAETWGWGQKQVRNFLEQLSIENMIEKGQSNGHWANVVTICNYDAYQNGTTEEGRSQGQCGASAGPVRGQTLTSNTRLVSNNAREEPKTDDGLKAAFNGSTDRMIADAMRWMNCPEENARKWLATTLSASGRDATIGAYQSLIEKQATNQPIASPMIYWARTAAGWKPPKQSAAKRYQTDEPRLVIDKQTPLNVRPA